MSTEAVGEPWSVEDVDGWVGDALAEVRWLQVAPLSRGEFGAEVLAALARAAAGCCSTARASSARRTRARSCSPPSATPRSSAA